MQDFVTAVILLLNSDGNNGVKVNSFILFSNG